MKMAILRKKYFNFDTEIIKKFVFQMWTAINQDCQFMTDVYMKYGFHLDFHTESQFT
jgi:hypothetical protein